MSSLPIDPRAPSAPVNRNVGPLLTLTAAIEAFGGLSSLPALFGDILAIPGFAGVLIKAHLLSHPLLAVAALLLVGRGQQRYAVIALALNVLMAWPTYLPSIALQGIGGGHALTALHSGLQIVAFPLMAACAIALSLRDQRQSLAAALVMLPTLVKIAGVLAFGMGVALYGF